MARPGKYTFSVVDYLSRLLILVTLVIGMLPFRAVPVLAAPLNTQRQAQTISSNAYATVNGSDVSDIAVNGGVVYIVDGQTATGNVYKSSDGGQNFTKAVPPASVALNKISVAPDNANVIAVADGATVYVSSDGGSTWSSLPALSGTWTGLSATRIRKKSSRRVARP